MPHAAANGVDGTAELANDAWRLPTMSGARSKDCAPCSLWRCPWNHEPPLLAPNWKIWLGTSPDAVAPGAVGQRTPRLRKTHGDAEPPNSRGVCQSFPCPRRAGHCLLLLQQPMTTRWPWLRQQRHNPRSGNADGDSGGLHVHAPRRDDHPDGPLTAQLLLLAIPAPLRQTRYSPGPTLALPRNQSGTLRPPTPEQSRSPRDPRVVLDLLHRFRRRRPLYPEYPPFAEHEGLKNK